MACVSRPVLEVFRPLRWKLLIFSAPLPAAFPLNASSLGMAKSGEIASVGDGGGKIEERGNLLYRDRVKLLRRWSLRNGLVFEAFDESYHYYGEYHNVRIIIRAIVPVEEGHVAMFKGTYGYEKVLERLLPEREFRREILKVGVTTDALERTKEEILRNFELNALSYLQREDFVQKFAKREFGRIQKEIWIEERQKEVEEDDS